MIKNLGQQGEEAFLHLHNQSMALQLRPLTWNQADIQPIPKPKDPSNPRPISLLNCLEKTAEKMVLNRLKHKIGPLHPHLYAYTEKVGTTECIADVLSYINGGSSIVIFLDLEKAFELANPAAILYSTVRKGVKGDLLSWVKNYSIARQARVKFQGELSSYKTFENGTPQGGILSRYLSNILMENLALLPLPSGVQIFIYADDVVIIAKGSNKLAQAQKAINQLLEKPNVWL